MVKDLCGPLAPKNYEDRRQRNNDVWYYEEPFGLTIVCGSNADCEMVVIPKKAILDYVAKLSTPHDDQATEIPCQNDLT